ncbi:MAG: fibrillarin-like rRNA/tRNA 2'-O-methyltransferase [Candidatus Diapherotrites archaeon]
MLQSKFSSVWTDGRKVYTQNLVPGLSVYGEKRISENGKEFREWNPFRSKLCAGICKGLKEFPFASGQKILYLGAAEGTTLSHVSDIVGKSGVVVGVDISPTVMRKLLLLAEQRENIFPLLADANQPLLYPSEIREMQFDGLVQDVSQKNQAEIFLKNAKLLKEGGFGLLAVKARSISPSLSPQKVFEGEVSKLNEMFNVIQTVPLAPFESDHLLVHCRRK